MCVTFLSQLMAIVMEQEPNIHGLPIPIGYTKTLKVIKNLPLRNTVIFDSCCWH